MGQAGSHEPRGGVAHATHLHRRAHTLPHEPLRHAPKVLPSLTESPRLRCTDNGQILHSGGTISGRRPASQQPEGSRTPHGHMHHGVYRSRSAGAAGEPLDLRSRERDPLHRSHTNLDLRQSDGSAKRFGSEPDLRVEEEQKKPRNNNKHFRKKYRAPPPPCSEIREGSSPDSSEGNMRAEPQRKLRLFKTRNETKKTNGYAQETKIPQYRRTDYHSLDVNDSQGFERRYKSPYKDRETHSRYPDNRDMMQTTASLKREENIHQAPKLDYRKPRDRVGGCKAKMTRSNEPNEAMKTPLLNRNFRYSERFKRDETELPPLRREKSFDATLISSERDSESPKALHETRMKTIAEQLKVNKLSPLASSNKPLRKSLPSLLSNNKEEKDEFQAELKKATSRIKNELLSKVNVSVNRASQNERTSGKPNVKIGSKVSQSSPRINYKQAKDETNSKLAISRRPLTRVADNKSKSVGIGVSAKDGEVKGRAPQHDRGQASGKESTPEHSPTRKMAAGDVAPNTEKNPFPSKQFYFGMVESAPAAASDARRDFPGLGSPVIQEISDFHLIEKKLLAYRDEEDEFDKFNAKLKADCKKNLSSESALSSGGSSGSAWSLGVALRLRPTLPQRPRVAPTFSPAAAWRELAKLDHHLPLESQPLAVETSLTTTPAAAAESSPRSEQSGCGSGGSGHKSADSGISADHNHDHNHQFTQASSSPDAWTPQQDLDSSSDGATHDQLTLNPTALDSGRARGPGATYSVRGQPFSLSLPREQDKGKQIQQGFNSLQKLRKSVSGALGAALGSRRFDLEHEPMLQEPEQNWFLTKSAPNSLSNPLLLRKTAVEDDIIEEAVAPIDKEDPLTSLSSWRTGAGGTRGAGATYMSWGGHVMYLPPAPATAGREAGQPLSLLGPIDRPVRSKSSGELEIAARAARAARAGLSGEMRERERSASPLLARALPARVESTYTTARKSAASARARSKRFTFQSTIRQLERRRIAERLSKEADLKEQQRKTELEAMRRVEEEFQRKRAREKASIRQQLRLVSGTGSMPSSTHKTRDEPDGSACESPALDVGGRERRGGRQRSNASSETSGRSKSTTPIRSIELSEWRVSDSPRQYRDWCGRTAPAHDHPPACARMPIATAAVYNATEVEAFTGSPRSDNYRLEFARGVPRSPRTPRPPRLLPAPRSPSTSGSELSMRQPIRIRDVPEEEPEEAIIVPNLRPSSPARAAMVIH